MSGLAHALKWQFHSSASADPPRDRDFNTREEERGQRTLQISLLVRVSLFAIISSEITARRAV